MNDSPLTSLVGNAALLLALVVVFDITTSHMRLEERPLRQVLAGLILGFLGIGLILTAFRLEPGIVFDTRSVLLGVSGLFFGPIPAGVAMAMTAAYRLSQGGIAAWPGVGVIVATGGLGIAWRRWRRGSLVDMTWRELYVFGMAGHLVMLAVLITTLPWENARRVLSAIGLPVLLVYPLATTALGLLLANRLRRERTVTELARTNAVLEAEIAEHRQAEEARRLSEAKLQAILDASPVAIGWTDATGRNEYLNRKWTDLFGYVVDDIPDIETWFLKAYPDPVYRAEIMRQWAADMANARHGNGEIAPREYTVTCRDGSTRQVSIAGALVGDLTLGLITDIAESKRAQESLRESEQRFRFLSELNDATRGLTEPGETMAAIVHLLGSRLHASRCAYADAEADGEQFTIRHDYTDGCASTVGDYRLSLFGPRSAAELRAGRALVINDVDAELAPGQGAEMFNAIGIKAIISCPLVKQGALRALISVHQTTPRRWTPGEIALVRDVAERSWAIIERTQAEKQAQASRAEMTRLLAAAETSRLALLSVVEDQKEAETQLKKLSLAVAQSPTSIVITDLKGIIEYVNPWFCTLTGYSFEEVYGQNPRVLKSGLTPPEIYRDMWATISNGHTWRGELVNRKKDGELYTELAVLAPVFGPDGHATHYVAIKNDITERKRAELALRENELRYRELFDLQSDTVLLVESDTGRIIQANQAASAMYGYTVAELETLRIVDISAELEKNSEITGQDARRTDMVVNIPHRLHRRRDGTIFPVEANLRFFERNGRSLLLTAIHDITAQVTARETLRNFNSELEQQVAQRTRELATNEERMRLVLEASETGTFEIDFSSGEGRWNSVEFSLLGLKPGDVPSNPESFFRYVHPDDIGPLKARWEEALRTGELDAEFRVVRADGQERWLAGKGRFASEGDPGRKRTRFFGVNFDITELKRVERETAALLEKEREVSELKTRFISMTSHEFRTPMTTIMGSTDLLSNHLDNLDAAKRQQLFDRIKTALRRMTGMLDDVLMLNRMDAHRTEVRPTTADLGVFVRNVLEEIRLGDHDGHLFELHAPADPAPFVTDINLLHHILTNLLSNAARYSPAGTVVTVRADIDAARARLVVEDQGIGIPPADRARIFEPFERGSNVGTIKGTGLGLNIVKRMTTLLGGTIAYEPVAGGGSRFTLELPQPQASPAP